ncbi:hypothetical protein VSDG_09472 [Cytospora chrysosperma]|uniref:TIGR02453 family protein n=1 Tax=Cytospora chrysosperma TaxID=252740 RepID=A0A423VAP5_CYTCH|nr:hypothetical protein VSDG_10151 [Valsa sordida]ROV87939.1 hypothetical protein VSDG_09472 [Valsa sordida]
MPPKKRSAASTSQAPDRRRSTRVSSSNQKSRYFESDSDDADGTDELGDGTTDESKFTSGRKRGRPAKKPTATQRRSTGKRAKIEHDDDDSDDVDDYKEDVKDKKQQQEGEEEEEDSDFDEDEKPRVTIIPLIKMRDTGGVDYEDDRLHKNTLLFLKDLKANNKRDWLKSRDDEYRRSLQDWNSYVESLMQKVIATDPTIPELPLKDIIFRIYRDIRFSKDPTPYKPHYAVAFSRTGRKGPYACYYVHCEPGSSIVGGGLWLPDAQTVAKLRASIDERPARWRRVLSDDQFRRTFLPTAKSGDEEGCLKAFCKANEGNALKTKPKGFDASHRNIELLKLRNFTVWKKIPDSLFTAEDGQAQITNIISAMVGFITFLNDVVMPDPDMDSDSSSEDEDEAEDEAEDADTDDD